MSSIPLARDAKAAPVSSINATREAQIEAAKFRGYKTNHLLLHGLKKMGRAAAWSFSGDRLAVASDLNIHLFPSPQHRGKPGMKDTTLVGHTGVVYDIVWHPTDSNILASVSADKTLRLWDVKAGKQTMSINLGESLNRVSWSPDAETMLICGARVLFTLDAKKLPEKAVKSTKLRQDFQQTLYSKDNSLVVVATSSDMKGTAPGVIQIFRPDNITPEGRYELSCHTGVTTCLASDKQGRLFASGGQDGIINIWDMEEIICTHSICNSDERVNSVSFSADGKLVASACDTQVFVNHVGSGEQIFSTKLSALAVCFHPSKLILAVVGEDDRNSSQATFARYIEFSSQ